MRVFTATAVVVAALAGGAAALESGFQMLGQLAMQELMTNPQVAGTLGSIEKYVDRTRIDAALRR